MTQIDPELKTWATERQGQYIDAINETGSMRKAAKKLGVALSALQCSLKLVQKKAAARGYSPAHDMTRPVPEPFVAKGISTLYNKDGGISAQWVKTALDPQRWREVVEEAVKALAEDVRGLAPLTAAPRTTAPELLAVYPFGDPHFGMYSWGAETGEDFDLAIARRITEGAVDRLVGSAPPAETAIVLPLGDVVHMDDQTNQTPAHKHQLDADGRFVKVLQVCIHTYRHIVLRCLEKHKRVVVRFVPGNHDPHAIWSLAFTLAAYFDNEPRVEVDLSPSPHWFYRFGRVLIGATHGDKLKVDKLLGVMAADRAEDWGQTLHRYWYLGHVHQQAVHELPGVTCESFRTLAARDAYAHGYGYRAGRDMRLIVHHKDHGEVERHRCDVGMLEPA